MRERSEYPSLPFHMHVKDHFVCDMSPIQDRNHTSESPEDYIHTSGNVPNEGSVDNTPHFHYETVTVYHKNIIIKVSWYC